MIRLSREQRLLAATLAGVAGFVDALGFIHLGGFFTSFMSGNSTRFAVGVVEGADRILLPAALIMLFVIGVVAGTLITYRTTGSRPLLLSIAALLALAAIAAFSGLAFTSILLTPIAMGAMNAVFQRDGEVSVGVTYMTGTLVKAGQRVAGAIAGGDRLAWLPYALLWVSLVAGAVLGSATYALIGLSSLWLPAAVLLAVALFAARPVG